ncbi:MAG: aminopeptidase P family protein, partial [Spirochaetaceae bacterium]|nr:aminopeptidase P family protein [Spirochaetaceae bacterium]
MTTPQRINSLRRLMVSSGVDAYIINGSDPHGSEYPSKRWRTREWISGFSGSAGIVVVTGEKAGLWTDFRYWIQASAELAESGIELYREGEEGVSGIGEWLSEILPSGSIVGFDGRTVSAKTAGEWNEIFQEREIQTDSSLDLINSLWADRPAVSKAAVIELKEEISGEARLLRMERLILALEKEQTDSWIGIGLDSTAWLLNVRGADVPYNPVVNGFLIYTAGVFTWYTDESRIPDELLKSLTADGVLTGDYNAFFPALRQISTDSRVLIDPQSITRAVLDELPRGIKIKTAADPVILMKSCKNEIEASRTSKAMEKDGVAMVRFMIKLEKAMGEGVSLTELDAAGMLLEERSSLPGFLEESFSPIPAFGSHGAICHYEATPEGAFKLEAGSNLLLLDSGGQWEEGTTDITRTIALGSPSEMQIMDYTLTLKGHISLSVARFPRGTRGYQLDALARNALWQQGINYGHGTGHGVGYRLNVHEGPHKISPAPIDVPLLPGMVVSNEPGVYRENKYGIRIENLLICREDITTEFGSFLAFDTLTLAPYDRRLIDTGLLNEGEIKW